MKIKTIVASEIATLDSDVLLGGGTDDTAALQAALDTAITVGGVKLIMDGAALVRGLRLHSNTTIECQSPDCGFYLADNSDCAVVTNANWQYYSLDTRNITLIGGTYNQNCTHQAHDIPCDPAHRQEAAFGDRHWMFGMEFYGIENLVVRDLVIRNQRTFAFMLACFKHCTIENVWLDLIDRMPANNQDGFHFWGPGQFLTIKNVGGRVGDDFMNLGPDEHDKKSSITDVLIDGVFLDDADQAIRMLSRGTGRLDRVTVRNMSGTYHGIGFYINQWFPDTTYGNFGNIKFENIDLRPLEVHYISEPFLFQLGGNIETMSFKNIWWHRPKYKYNLFQIGIPFYDRGWQIPDDNKPHMGTIIVDGLHIDDNYAGAADTDYMYIQCPVDTLILRDIEVVRSQELPVCGTLLRTLPGCELGSLIARRIYTQKLDCFADLRKGIIGNTDCADIVCSGTEGALITR
jgi:hypothetical protein